MFPKRWIAFILASAILLLFLIRPSNTYNIDTIPLPNRITKQVGEYIISENDTIFFSDSIQYSDAEIFCSLYSKLYNAQFVLSPYKSLYSKGVYLLYDSSSNLGQESYELKITPNQVIIRASSGGSGFYYALQTLLQSVVEKNIDDNKIKKLWYCSIIKDSPEMLWRGLHLDVSRHFFSKQTIFKYIDLMSMYKLNYFHWHLTDDQGWRMEISKYPKLTDVGAWRKGTPIGESKMLKVDSTVYGGYYTKSDIKEIVAYAQKRHISIVPEIDMPCHISAALAAYPWLSCSGEPFDTGIRWGVYSQSLCMKDSVFNFMYDVIDEIISLFPGKYIHIGGDECRTPTWEKCTNCKETMRKNNIEHTDNLQVYFTNRIASRIKEKGHIAIVWEEAMGEKLNKDIVIMIWQGSGIEARDKALQEGHKVILSPQKPMYFDHYQFKDRKKQPIAIGGFNSLRSVYNYFPKKNLSFGKASCVLGVQANVWTEYISSEKHLWFMVYPRVCALADVAWTNNEFKNYNTFQKRLQRQKLSALIINEKR